MYIMSWADSEANLLDKFKELCFEGTLVPSPFFKPSKGHTRKAILIDPFSFEWDLPKLAEHFDVMLLRRETTDGKKRWLIFLDTKGRRFSVR